MRCFFREAHEVISITRDNKMSVLPGIRENFGIGSGAGKDFPEESDFVSKLSEQMT